jgi:Raf kinase inhibitor-like YbhB/YbcL family protein
MKIESTAFGNNQPIPIQYTADGRNISPPLRWSEPPDGSKELSLIVDDPDAPTSEPWVHWVIYRIPVDAPGLPEDIAHDTSVKSPAGAIQGKNTWDRIGWGGPEPPRGHGVHHYHFTLYALDRPLQVYGGLDKKALIAAMAGGIIGQAELVGTFER